MPRQTLTRGDWIRVGQELLADGGIGAVQLRHLTRRLQVSSGSFYHHFDGMPGFLDELAGEYGSVTAEGILARCRALEPAERVEWLRALVEDPFIPRLDRSMRVWATGDARAAAAVRTLDTRLLAMVRAALTELGFPPGQARLRALLAYSAGVGLSITHSPWTRSPGELDAALVLAMGAGPGQGGTACDD